MKDSRLSDLPEELRLRILGCLDAKQAVQTTILSRSWLSLWTRIPVLEFNPLSFHKNSGNFRKFVNEIMSRRDPLAKLDSLKFNSDQGCSAKISDFAKTYGVKHLEAPLEDLLGNDSWPVSLCDSLMSLKLVTWRYHEMNVCPFLGPRSVLFKNLTVLYLYAAIITYDEPFSGFLVLERLTLLCCFSRIPGDHKSKTLKLHALRLSDLTISGGGRGVHCLELRTPRLRFLEYGSYFPKHDQGLPVFKHEGLLDLKTLAVDVNSNSYCNFPKKRRFDDLLSLLSTLDNVKFLTLFSYAVFVLVLYQDELVRRSSPFRELKDLKLDLSNHYCYTYSVRKPSRESFECVKAYFLQNSPHAKITIINCSDSRSKSCTCFQFLSL